MGYGEQLFLQLPLLIAVIGGATLLILDAFARGASRRWLMHLCVLISAVGLFSCWTVWRHITGYGAHGLFSGMLIADHFSLVLTALFFCATAITAMLSADFFTEHAVLYGELYPLLLFTTAGMIILAMAGDLLTVFLGIETMSMGAYVLTGSFRRAKRSSEAAMKYFVTGAFATGILLYGIALVYGAVGSTNLADIHNATAAHGQGIFLIGEFMLIVALGFKVAAVPFHMWTPDVYEGAPSPITGFMGGAVKAAGIAGLIRVFMVGMGGDLAFGHFGWGTMLSIIAVLTMTVGNVAALRQENLKRMLAYSSIAHAGYLLVGVIAGGMGASVGIDVARPALLYYLVAYAFTTLGAFGVLTWLGGKSDEHQLVDDWAGLGSRYPLAAAAMTVFMLSLGGIPPTGGFVGKFYVFRAALEPDSQLTWLVVAAVLNSVISMFYYLRVISAMYFRDGARDFKPASSVAARVAIGVCLVVVIAMGVLPNGFLGVMNGAAITIAVP